MPPRDNFTYYIHETMLGDHATAQDAHRMVEVLYDLGYEVQYGDEPNPEGSLIPDKDWETALATVREEHSVAQEQ